QSNDLVVRFWLHEDSGLAEDGCQLLLSSEARPAHLFLDDTLVMVLRGVNAGTAVDLEDMVSFRLWVEPNRVITLRDRRLLAAQKLQLRIQNGERLNTSSDLLLALLDGLVEQLDG